MTGWDAEPAPLSHYAVVVIVPGQRFLLSTSDVGGSSHSSHPLSFREHCYREMVRRIGWGRSRGQLGCWGDSGSVPLIPLPPPPLPPLCRGPGAGRVSIFSLSSAPHVRNTSSSLPTQSLGSPCPAVQAPGVSQPPSSVPPTPATPPGQGRLVMSPISAAPSWGSHPVPPLALVTSPPSRQYPQDPPGLRIGPLIPEQDYERLGDCDPEGSQESPIHGEEQPLLHVPEGLRGECWGADDPRGLSLATAKSPPPLPRSPLCSGSWHHIQNLDTFFTKISFVFWKPRGGFGDQKGPEKAFLLPCFLMTSHLQLSPEGRLYLHPARGPIPTGVRCAP